MRTCPRYRRRENSCSGQQCLNTTRALCSVASSRVTTARRSRNLRSRIRGHKSQQEPGQHITQTLRRSVPVARRIVGRCSHPCLECGHDAPATQQEQKPDVLDPARAWAGAPMRCRSTWARCCTARPSRIEGDPRRDAQRFPAQRVAAYLCRWLWSKPPAVMVGDGMLSAYATALTWRIPVNWAYRTCSRTSGCMHALDGLLQRHDELDVSDGVLDRLVLRLSLLRVDAGPARSGAASRRSRRRRSSRCCGTSSTRIFFLIR